MANKTAWKEEFVWRVYEAGRLGFDTKKAAKFLGISKVLFEKWLEKKQSFKDAYENGMKLSTESEKQKTTLGNYIYDQLPIELRALWDTINDSNAGCSLEDLECLFESSGGEKAQKQLFVHAMANSSFSPSVACKKIGISKKRLDHWLKTDPLFADLLDEVTWHKKNFIEEALFDLVKARDVSAVIFAAKTLNQDRGYNPTVTHKHTGSIEHNVNRGVLDVATLDMSLEAKKELLAAMRKKREEQEQLEAELTDEKAPPRKALPVSVKTILEDDSDE